jgi:spore coat polysaccharide biosynthesis protein SpsF
MSFKVVGLLTVRSNSSRLPNKCFLKLNDIILLQHIITRCILGGIEPVVCTTNNSEDRKIVKLAKKNKIKFFAGSEKNKILRWYECCKIFNLKAFHTIDADDPFFDWESVKKSFKELKRSKKDIILPSRVSRDGAASEGYSISIKCLEKIFSANKNYKKKEFDTEMLEPFLNKKITSSTLKGSIYEIKKARLTLDYEDDFKLLSIIANKCGNFASRRVINLFLNKNKKLLKINSAKNSLWKSKQNNFIKRS